MRRQTFFLPIIIALGACSGGEPTELPPPAPLPTDGVTSEQRRAFIDLETRTKQRWTWAQHATRKTPMHLSTARTGKPVLRNAADAEKVTLSFLRENKALFKMRDPSAELAIERSDVDELGMTHVRFQQVTRGVPVVGAELSAHYDEVGHIAAVDANYVAGLNDVDVQPKLDADATRAIVEADVLSRTPSLEKRDLSTSDAKLVVLANGDAPPRLAYERTVDALAGRTPAIWVMTVDATTGEIIDRYDNLQRLKATASGVFGDSKSFEVTQSAGEFQMVDATGSAEIVTRTAGNAMTLTSPKVVSSTSLTEWDRVTAGAGSAVDAHAYAALVLKYYKERHQRNGIDGTGRKVFLTVHYGQDLENAFWSNGLLFGDGGPRFHPFAGDLTVVAHEFSHGVTESTSGLVYQNQSGALNEAFSDIIGVFVGHAFEPSPKEWTVMEKAAKVLAVKRDLSNPRLNGLPSAMSEFVQTTQDNGGVHTNSVIIGHAAFLMTVGGTNVATKIVVKSGIGWEKAEKLWYRANTRYFLRSSDFGQAALAVLTSAKDLGFTKSERNVVATAFAAVGLETPPEPPEPTPAPDSDAGADSEEKTTTTSPTSDEATHTPAEDAAEEVASTSDETAPKKKKVLMTVSSCNTTPPRKGATPFAGLLAVALVLALRRGRDRRVNPNS